MDGLDLFSQHQGLPYIRTTNVGHGLAQLFGLVRPRMREVKGLPPMETSSVLGLY